MSTEYASAVAAVRAMESALLSQADIERLIAAESWREAADILRSVSINPPETSGGFIAQLDDELEKTWEFISSYVPSPSELDLLLYKNDFHDLKAALKSLMSNTDPKELYLRPTLLDLDTLYLNVREKHWEMLPEHIRETAEKVYDSLAANMDGQLADMMTDRACLEKMREKAKLSGNDLLIRYAELTALFADIKTAYRLSLMNKTEAFIQTAVCGSDELDAAALARAAAGGFESLTGLLESTGFGELAELLKASPAQFEKRTDDLTAALIEDARMKSFGLDPLAAYYLAKETQIKNLRIIFVCKDCGADTAIIKERMRMLYV